MVFALKRTQTHLMTSVDYLESKFSECILLLYIVILVMITGLPHPVYGDHHIPLKEDLWVQGVLTEEIHLLLA